MGHKSIRIFKHSMMESLTHVDPLTPLLVWGPINCYLILYTLFMQDMPLITFLVMAIMGLFTWTLAEYLLHRYLFHFSAKGAMGKRLVFLFHGLHHDDPDDPTRLVMPPIPGLLMSSVLYGLFYLFLGAYLINVFFAFFMIGYLCYDYIHYATHHFSMQSAFWRSIKRHHLLHHHTTSHGKFGVSSPLWDYIFKSLEGARH